MLLTQHYLDELAEWLGLGLQLYVAPARLRAHTCGEMSKSVLQHWLFAAPPPPPPASVWWGEPSIGIVAAAVLAAMVVDVCYRRRRGATLGCVPGDAPPKSTQSAPPRKCYAAGVSHRTACPDSVPSVAACAAPVKVDVIHSCARLCAVNKPSGMPTMPWSSADDPNQPAPAPSLDEVLRGWPLFQGSKVHLVNRLDRMTSGLVLVGRTPEAAAELAEAMADEASAKVYVVLVRGVASPAFTVDRPLRQRDAAAVANKSSRRAKQAVAKLNAAKATQDAVTDFVRVAACCDGHCSLLLAMPRTGRRHQIRRHLDGARHQVSGDKQYGPSGINALLRAEYGLERMFLHACCTRLPTLRGGPRCLVAPLPDSLREPLGRMRGGTDALAALERELAVLSGPGGAGWVEDARRRCAAGERVTSNYRAGIVHAAASPSESEKLHAVRSKGVS